MTVTPPHPSGSTGSGSGVGPGFGSGTGVGPRAGSGVSSGSGSGMIPGSGTGTDVGPGPGARTDAGPGSGGPLIVPPARSAAEPVRRAPELPPVSRRFLAKATAVTAALSVAGALLGLVRDQSLARLFGAGSGTDAFLVAWTVPEFASTLLIEDGLAFVLIPAFSLALARRAQGAPGDPVRSLVGATLPRLVLVFVAASALIVATAPYLVQALAPGLPDPALAVDCTRLTATCVLSFGLAGYCSAVLRAHRRFLMPGAIYVAYNTGIIAAMFVLGGDWGVRSAAVGVAAGGALMVAVQLPAMWRQLRRSPVRGEEPVETPDRAVTLALVATVLLFALCRQSQVLVERFLASPLPAGAISHLNYAQKVAQIPMTLSLMLCTVTFPVVARALADGDTERARARVERDLALAACTVLLGAATVIACAPQIIEVLFQRGAFTARDTAATAGVMRVYALGLLGQTLVGALIRSYFSAGRPTWYPVCAMAAGIVVTSWSGAWAVGPWGVSGIAAANAAGITVTASLLLAGMGTAYRGVPRGVPVRTRKVLAELIRPVCAAAVATPAGWLVANRAGAPLPGLLAGSATVAAVFVLLGLALGAQGFAPALRSVRAAARTITRRLPHGR
ncbi:putative peptidoglycan lipid II flippase [Streptomyces sp. SAI-135]|uniref:murein biosynthesis integral membrane protein MurJ n=2 Tax=Streptomyces TaxID=1883 RepID=UPI002476CB42|nr:MULTISPECIES: lipid II flippase MurJ [unclassified Streptomyces]MDH6518956.1 putative peptidoglycan lipid II flippase [Streptomyces sp. SAI-090]MDH6616949.1 putative peptidoglycan lipid II flippase [Streptomyces sp. SAI-135]